MLQTVSKPLLRSLVGLASVIEARDPYTGGHCWRVGQFSMLLAGSLGLDADEVFLAGIGGVLHDVGKVAVPDAILRKPGRLTEEEFSVIRTHPSVGRDLLASHPLADLVLDAVSCHHERPDGLGYPNGLAGDDIELVTRIVGLTDAFDAMTSARPYRTPMAIPVALSILKEEGGRQFDSMLADAFAKLHDPQDRLSHIVGHTDTGRALATCPNCGPIVVLSPFFKDGDIAVCRNCGGKMVMHKQADHYVPELVGVAGSADDLRPRPETESLEFFVNAAPKPRRFFGNLGTLWGSPQ